MSQSDDSMVWTKAEERAETAEGLDSLGSFNLRSIKRVVTQLLSEIGRSNIFSEYTKHDISHINEMLRLLEWIVPEEVKQYLSPTDWLHVVLAVYFHDLGMLVTEQEYEDRARSGFNQFKEETLFSGPRGSDYRLKVTSLGNDKAERFFYQEFVRHTHASRIRKWLTGAAAPQWGISAVAT